MWYIYALVMYYHNKITPNKITPNTITHGIFTVCSYKK